MGFDLDLVFVVTAKVCQCRVCQTSWFDLGRRQVYHDHPFHHHYRRIRRNNGGHPSLYPKSLVHRQERSRALLGRHETPRLRDQDLLQDHVQAAPRWFLDAEREETVEKDDQRLVEVDPVFGVFDRTLYGAVVAGGVEVVPQHVAEHFRGQAGRGES